MILCVVSCLQQCNADSRVRGWGLTLTFVALGGTVCLSLTAASTASLVECLEIGVVNREDMSNTLTAPLDPLSGSRDCPSADKSQH